MIAVTDVFLTTPLYFLKRFRKQTQNVAVVVVCAQQPSDVFASEMKELLGGADTDMVLGVKQLLCAAMCQLHQK